MQQFSFPTIALLLLFVNPKNGTAHVLQVERPARSCAEILEIGGDGNVVHAKSLFEVERCLEENASFVYGGESPPTPEVREAG